MMMLVRAKWKKRMALLVKSEGKFCCAFEPTWRHARSLMDKFAFTTVSSALSAFWYLAAFSSAKASCLDSRTLRFS